MIRSAVAGDIPRLAEMGEKFYAESTYSSLIGFNREAFSSAMRSIIGTDSAVVLVCDDDDGVVGMICGVIGPHFMTGQLFASELFWWMDPDHRGRGILLLLEYEAALKARGVRLSGMVAPAGEIQLERVYERKGFVRAESVYMRSL